MPEQLETQLADLPARLKSQYVIDVKAPGLPSDAKVALRIDAKSPTGALVSAEYPRRLKLPETARKKKAGDKPDKKKRSRQDNAVWLMVAIGLGALLLGGGGVYLAMRKRPQ